MLNQKIVKILKRNKKKSIRKKKGNKVNIEKVIIKIKRKEKVINQNLGEEMIIQAARKAIVVEVGAEIGIKNI